MKIKFGNNTLTDPTQAVKGTKYTRQDLLAAADVFFDRYRLVRVAVSDDAAPYVTAYGVFMLDETRGYGIHLEVGPSACGTGIVFDAHAIMNFGATWERENDLGKVCGYHRWSTSEKLIQFGFPRECDPRYVKAIGKTFKGMMGLREQTIRNREAVEAVGQRLFGKSTDQVSGNNYVVQVLPGQETPEILLNIRTTDVAKVEAILALLKS